MPELPEVEVVRRGLDRWVTGRTVASVEVRHPRATRRHLAGPEDFAARLNESAFRRHSAGVPALIGTFVAAKRPSEGIVSAL